MKKFNITTDFIRLGEFLKASCICSSGGEAKILIKSGSVKLNGEICTLRGKKLIDGDVINIADTEYVIKNEAC